MKADRTYVDDSYLNAVTYASFNIHKTSNELAGSINRIDEIVASNVVLALKGNNYNNIINNVYDDDLIVTGKLTVGKLEVTNLGIVYEDTDGADVNSDINPM
jgi:hypothetical protein